MTSRTLLFGVLALAGTISTLVTHANPPDTQLPDWISSVGARQHPSQKPAYSANDYGAKGDGTTLNTDAIQKTIDACSEAGGGEVTLKPGRYLTGALFIKSGVDFHLGKGVTLLGSQVEKNYPERPTRVAGIEMTWPAALLNIYGQHDATISGHGTVDGQGEVWWKKYWTMRKDYEKRGLRWAVDYDCQRVRLLVVWKSSDVTIKNLHLKRSGFWTVQLTYSDHVTVDGIKISDNAGPSTDGVDVDSSSHVLVQNCDIDNNDDCICMKAGRDYDGLRVNRPTEYVVIRHNITRRGGGVVSFGSETSGGIRHIVAYDDTALGTNEGLRFKSAHTRGGYIEDVLIKNVTMKNVPSVFSFTLNWNPSYSYAVIPPGMKNVPNYWKVMATPVEPASRGLTEMRDITFDNIKATGARRILSASGLPAKPLGAMRWENINVSGQHAGSIHYAEDWTMKNVRFSTPSGKPVKVSHCRNVEAPTVVKVSASASK